MSERKTELTIHLRVSDEDLEHLDRIAEHMRRDPLLGKLRIDLGREKAIRYAVAKLIEALPAEAG